MTEEMESVLRRSLDEVDRARKRQWVYLALSVICLGMLVTVTTEIAYRMGDNSLVVAMGFGALISVLTNIFVILGLSLFINRMTTRILRAIELTARK